MAIFDHFDVQNTSFKKPPKTAFAALVSEHQFFDHFLKLAPVGLSRNGPKSAGTYPALLVVDQTKTAKNDTFVSFLAEKCAYDDEFQRVARITRQRRRHAPTARNLAHVKCAKKYTFCAKSALKVHFLTDWRVKARKCACGA